MLPNRHHSVLDRHATLLMVCVEGEEQCTNEGDGAYFAICEHLWADSNLQMVCWVSVPETMRHNPKCLQWHPYRPLLESRQALIELVRRQKDYSLQAS